MTTHFLHPVPHCDLEDVPLGRVMVDGDAYNWHTAWQYYAAYECDNDEEQGKQLWNMLPPEERIIYDTAEAQDRERALQERLQAVHAIVNSSTHVAFETQLDSSLVLGIVGSIDVYYVHERDTQAVWITGSLKPIVDALFESVHFVWPEDFAGCAVELEQRIYHTFLQEELKLHFGPR